MQEFQGKHGMNFGGVIPVSLEMTPNHGFNSVLIEVRPRKCPRVEQHFLNVPGEGIPIPNTKMVELVPPKKKAFEMQPRE